MDQSVELGDLARLGKIIDGALWAVTGLVLVFTCVNVTLFAEHHGVWLPIALLLDPMVSLALVVVLLGDERLARLGIRPTGWGVVLRWFAALVTWAMNVWESLFPYHSAGLSQVDIAGVVLHSVPPALLIVLTEAAAGYRRRIADAVSKASPKAAVPAGVPSSGSGSDPVVVRDVPPPRLVTDTGTPEGREWPPSLVSLPTGSSTAGSGSRTGSAPRSGSAGTGSGSGSEGSRASGNTRPRVSGSSVVLARGSRPARRDGEPTPTELARAHWDAERAAGRTPSGAELDRVAGTTDFGRKLRRQWLAEEPIEAEQATGDGAQAFSPAQTQAAGGTQ
ncbi:MAG TPA: hypothetical protein VIS06_06285 [Mycobacteriales bacterium]